MGLASCEAEKKRLIAEEKYEDVIAIRDTAKKMEKRLLPIEKIDELKSFYENAHGRAFSSLCLDRLAEMNIAEKECMVMRYLRTSFFCIFISIGIP